MEEGGVRGGGALPVRARSPDKIATFASDPINPCKTRNTDRCARRRGCERRGDELLQSIRARIVGRLCQTPFVALAFDTNALQDPFPFLDGCDWRRYS